MRMNLLSVIFYGQWEMWQDIAIIAAIAVAALLFFIILAFLILNNAHMEADGRRIAKRVAWYEERIELERKALEAEEEKARLELAESRQELNEKREAADAAESKAALARRQLKMREQELRKLFDENELNKKELAEYQKREGTYVPEDVVINILTERVINESSYEMDAYYTDCKIPQAVSTGNNIDYLNKYIAQKPNVEVFEGTGKRPTRYKVDGKVFALVYALENGRINVSYKCGTDYGTKLTKHLKGVVSKAQFPYGLIWYNVTDEIHPCSFELIKLLTDISYKIAKLGY